MTIRWAALAAIVGVALAGCGGEQASAGDAQRCKAMRSVQSSYDLVKDQASDHRAAVLQDYIKLPGNVGKADDEKLNAALDAARGRQPQAEGTIPVEGGKLTADAIKPVLARCAELGA